MCSSSFTLWPCADNGRLYGVRVDQFSHQVWNVHQISQLKQEPSTSSGHQRQLMARRDLSQLHQLHRCIHRPVCRHTCRQYLWSVHIRSSEKLYLKASTEVTFFSSLLSLSSNPVPAPLICYTIFGAIEIIRMYVCICGFLVYNKNVKISQSN